MQIQVHSDKHVEGSARLADWVTSTITAKVGRFDEEVTRIVVHISDQNAEKAGRDDKRCQIEARPKGQPPISVTHKADSVNAAVDGAIDKLNASLTSLFGKLRSKRTTPAPGLGTDADSGDDELLEEEYLSEEE